MDYKTGDLVIYGDTGVCRIDDIADKSMPSGMQLCYKLQPLYQSCTIFTPVENGLVYMRPVISKEEAERLIDFIPACEPEICKVTAPRELSSRYDEILKCHDCEKLIHLTMSIYAKKRALVEQKKKLSAVDEKYMKKAEELLFGELAAALDIPRDKITSYIESRTA